MDRELKFGGSNPVIPPATNSDGVTIKGEVKDDTLTFDTWNFDDLPDSKLKFDENGLIPEDPNDPNGQYAFSRAASIKTVVNNKVSMFSSFFPGAAPSIESPSSDSPPPSSDSPVPPPSTALPDANYDVTILGTVNGDTLIFTRWIFDDEPEPNNYLIFGKSGLEAAGGNPKGVYLMNRAARIKKFENKLVSSFEKFRRNAATAATGASGMLQNTATGASGMLQNTATGANSLATGAKDFIHKSSIDKSISVINSQLSALDGYYQEYQTNVKENLERKVGLKIGLNNKLSRARESINSQMKSIESNLSKITDENSKNQYKEKIDDINQKLAKNNEKLYDPEKTISTLPPLLLSTTQTPPPLVKSVEDQGSIEMTDFSKKNPTQATAPLLLPLNYASIQGDETKSAAGIAERKQNYTSIPKRYNDLGGGTRRPRRRRRKSKKIFSRRRHASRRSIRH
jgi:hypothetical protein